MKKKRKIGTALHDAKKGEILEFEPTDEFLLEWLENNQGIKVTHVPGDDFVTISGRFILKNDR